MSKQALTVMVLMMLFIPAFGGPFDARGAVEPDPMAPARQDTVINRALRYRLSEVGPGERVELLVQFQDEVTREDLLFLDRNGFEVHRRFTALPGLFATGTAEGIQALAEYHRTFWVEYNAPMTYSMNMTVDTIEARKVWLSQIRDGDRVQDPIDGSGVTVVVLDSGIDASHPDLIYTPVNIAAGELPAPGQKVILNVKKDQNIAGEPFVPFKNTDTTSGHGTHCAGTVAGTGHASAGRIKGVAPGAWLIGVSMGELFATIDEYSGLEWVYEHSRPGNNPANIRVVTNSWGPGYPFDSLDPNDASVQIIEKITHENNVVVVFAAGNDGSSNHDGSTDTVNIFAKIPSVIGVAASTRDGTGMAGFSSRGLAGKGETWPDIAAPGVRIWSASARATMIGAGIGLQDLTRDEKDPYYIAISGTSMATPHVAGLVALLWQACPSMGMSDSLEDHDGDPPVVIEENSGNFFDGPYEFSDLRIHEAELILKLTADYIRPEAGNGVPSGEGATRQGLDGRTLDFAQGYGLVNANRAVALALKLQQMRDPDGDGEVDHPDVTVRDAYRKLGNVIKQGMYSRKTDRIWYGWEGTFVDSDKVLGEESAVYRDAVPMANQKRSVFIPEETEELLITLSYYPTHFSYSDLTDLPEGSFGILLLTIDVNEDGQYDYPEQINIPTVIGGIDPSEKQTVTIRIDFTIDPFTDARGRNWTFDTFGYAYGIGGVYLDFFMGKGTRIEYQVDLLYRMNPDRKPRIGFLDYRFHEPSSQYYEGKITLRQQWYVLSEKKDEDEIWGELSPGIGVSLILLLAVGLAASWLQVQRKFGFIGIRPDQDNVRWEIPGDTGIPRDTGSTGGAGPTGRTGISGSPGGTASPGEPGETPRGLLSRMSLSRVSRDGK